MGKIIDFFKKKSNEDIELQAGGKLEILGRVKDMGVLINKFVFPIKKEDLTEEMVNYQKRYQLTMAVDQVMQRVQNDPEIAGVIVGLLIIPQKVEEENGQQVMTTQVELVRPMIVDLKTNATIKVNTAEEVKMEELD